MELRAVSAGSYPRSGDGADERRLRQACGSFRAGEISAAALRQVEDDVTVTVIEEQAAAGLDLVTDGLVRWYDPISHVAQALMGISPGRLRPFFHTGTAYREPVVRGPLVRTRSIVAHEFTFAATHSPRPVRAVLTGPLTLAAASVVETPAYPTLATLARSYAAILAAEVAALVEAGARYVQLDEPALLARPDAMDIAAETLAPILAVKGDAELSLAPLLSDPTPALATLAALPVDVLTLDLLRSPRAVEAVMAASLPQRLALGVVDAHNVTSDDIGARARLVEALLPHLAPGTHYLTSTGGLEYVPRRTAREKLVALTAIRSALLGGTGDAI